MIATANALKDHGATDIYCSVTHPVLAGKATEVITNSTIKELIITDTLPVPPEKRHSKIKTVSVAALLGEAIHRIHSGLSVGAMFEP